MDKRVQELRHAMALLPEGRELLEFANKTNIAIKFTEMNTKTVGGRLVTRGANTTLELNAGEHESVLVTTKFHELHHLRQLSASGRLEKGGVPRFPGSEDAYFTYLIAEADAHTFQTYIALKYKEAGYPQYFEGFISSNSDTVQDIKRFLTRNPRDAFVSTADFSRALFRSLLFYGMKGYERNFFNKLGASIGKLKTVEDIRLVVRAGDLPAKTSTEFRGHADIYGPGFLEGAHLQEMREILLARLSPEKRIMLQAAKTLENEASSLTQERLDALKNVISRNRKTKN